MMALPWQVRPERPAALDIDCTGRHPGLGPAGALPHAILVENDQHCRDADHRDCQAALQVTRQSVRTGIDCLTSARHSPRPKAQRSDAAGTAFLREK